MERLPRPEMIRMSLMPARTASSTTYWMAGLSTTGSISLGCAFVAGRNRVPSPAAGMTAFLTFIFFPDRDEGSEVYSTPRGIPNLSPYYRQEDGESGPLTQEARA